MERGGQRRRERPEHIEAIQFVALTILYPPSTAGIVMDPTTAAVLNRGGLRPRRFELTHAEI